MKRALRVCLAILALPLATACDCGSDEYEGCFGRLRPGPNSNTSRLDTTLDIPPSEWPQVEQIFREFADERGWSVRGGVGTSDPNYRWLTMCDPVATTIRAGNLDGTERRIGFGIIHMDYHAGDDDWQPFYRDLHERLEARWPGRMSYIEGEFGQTISRPEWLGAAPATE